MDALGRIVIPMEVRRVLDLADDDLLELREEGGKVILSKHISAQCIFCGSETNLMRFKGRAVCRKCVIAAENETDKTEKGVPTMSKRPYFCGLCNQAIDIPDDCLQQVADKMGNNVEKQSTKTYICEPCSKTAEYKSEFFSKLPHVVLAVAPSSIHK